MRALAKAGQPVHVDAHLYPPVVVQLQGPPVAGQEQEKEEQGAKQGCGAPWKGFGALRKGFVALRKDRDTVAAKPTATEGGAGRLGGGRGGLPRADCELWRERGCGKGGYVDVETVRVAKGLPSAEEGMGLGMRKI